MERLQTLERRSKLYGAAPNITTSLETLRRRSKLYGAAPNITIRLRNFTARLQALRCRFVVGRPSSKSATSYLLPVWTPENRRADEPSSTRRPRGGRSRSRGD